MKEKKFLRIAAALILTLTIPKQLNAQSAIITTIVDGTVASDPCSGASGSDPRFVELYVSGTLDFTDYDLDVETNGPSSGVGDWVSKNISSLGTITNQFVYLVLTADLISFDSAFPGKTRIGIALGTINGNDSFRIEDPSGNIIDLFGNPSEILTSSTYTGWNYQDSYVKRKNGKTANAGIFTENDFNYAGANTLDGADCTTLATAVNLGSYLAWTGTTNNVWSTSTNWSTYSTPIASDDVVIPNGLTTYPTIADATSVTVNSITINNGASLIAEGTSTVTGNVTYKRTVDFVSGNLKGWFLMASPVLGQDYNDTYVTDNDIASNGTNRGIATYTSITDSWAYHQGAASAAFTSGKGYSVKRQTNTGTVSFKGTVNTIDTGVDAVLSSDGNRFNLLGNPYNSFLSSTTFLNDETAISATKTMWIYNQTLGTNGSYEVKTIGDDFKIAPAQGFFVKADVTGGVFNFTESNQIHNADTFLKGTGDKTEIKLFITDGSINQYAKIYYLNNTTTGFDVGYDGELFSGFSNSFAVYSHLVANNEGKKYQVQSLPNSKYENMVIPLGVNAENGKEITFSTEVLNLPRELKVFLEDRFTNTFIRLDESNSEYKIKLTEALNGIGRFYLHTTASVLDVHKINLDAISIYKANKSTIRIVGLQQDNANIKLFNILGKQVMNTSFTSNGVSDISLPKLVTGVYFAKVQTETGKVSKKIILE
ncbi:T9SS type A sorting domain-containing protein [Polaribacter sp. SA4-12]|uniref:T9SS type A sorting domain-containing protein n=1 Tax=Polaribacter sp. SA4-12 TaxID=1312072 RepID=UPI0012FCAB7F|nr:T9SS type A sorting domain-containing protein [Polaribacter sp. SA4-12]